MSLSIVTTSAAPFASAVSPAFSGMPTVPTAPPGTNTTQIANCEFVADAVSSVVISGGGGGDAYLNGNNVWTNTNTFKHNVRILATGISGSSVGIYAERNDNSVTIADSSSNGVQVTPSSITIGQISTSANPVVKINGDVDFSRSRVLSIGLCASVTDAQSIAFGTNAHADYQSISFGYDAQATSNAISIGNRSSSIAASVVVGHESTSEEGGVAAGYNTSAGFYGTSIGHRTISDKFSIAFGYEARAGSSSVAIGRGAVASAYNRVEIAPMTTAANAYVPRLSIQSTGYTTFSTIATDTAPTISTLPIDNPDNTLSLGMIGLRMNAAKTAAYLDYASDPSTILSFNITPNLSGYFAKNSLSYARTGALYTDSTSAVSTVPGVVLVDAIITSVTSAGGTTVVDGYTPVQNDIVLIAGGGVSSGIYRIDTTQTPWPRATGFTTGESLRGLAVLCRASSQGTHAGMLMQNVNSTAITIGTTVPLWTSPMGNPGSGVFRLGNSLAGSETKGIEFFSGNGTVRQAYITKASGLNSTWTFTNVGTGATIITNTGAINLTSTGNSIVLTHGTGTTSTFATGVSGNSSLLDGVTTGSFIVGASLTTGTITYGNAAGTGQHTFQSGTTAGTATLRINNGANAANATLLQLTNTNNAATANKAVDLTFAADSTPFIGGRIRTNSTQAFVWNSASQRTEMIFSGAQGTTLTDYFKADSKGRLMALRGIAENSQLATPTNGSTVTIADTDAVVIIEPAGALSSLNIALPVDPADTQVVKISFTQAISSITWSAGPASAAYGNGMSPPLSAAAGDRLTYTYKTSTNRWYRIG